MRLRALFSARRPEAAAEPATPDEPRARPAPAAAERPSPPAAGKSLPTAAERVFEGPAYQPTLAFFSELSKDLAAGPLNLPCFPDIVPRVHAALADPSTSADDIVRIAGVEPRLTARLLQTANSTVFNRGGRPITELKGAVTRLGHSLVQSVTMAFAVQQMKVDPQLKTVAVPLATLWEKSMAVGSICQVLAKQIGVPSDKVFLTGLLHGIGHFYVLVRAAQPDSPLPYGLLAGDLVAARHPAFGRAVLTKWGLEPIVCEAVGRQLDYRRQSKIAADINDVLTASVVLAEALLDFGGDLVRVPEVSAFERLGLRHDALTAVLAHTEHTLGTLRESFAP